LRGKGFRSIERLTASNRKKPRRYAEAAVAAGAFFGGVFQRVIPDNVGTVVIKADKTRAAVQPGVY
jgi:hypothetical protein